MLRSMYSGISGMKGFQTSLDTIGNNIANVNTSGFKKGRVSFQDMMSQSVAGAQGAVEGAGGNVRGGINPSQVGLGSQMGSIDSIHTQGNRQTTDRPLDLAIEGDGMFVLAEGLEGETINAAETFGDEGLANLNTSFTRAGNFYLDEEGAIVNGDGKYLVGESYDTDADPATASGEAGVITIPENAQSFNIQSDGTVGFVDEGGNPQTAGQIRLANFSNPEGLEKVGGSTYQNTDNAGLFVGPGGEEGVLTNLDDLQPAGQNGTGEMVSGSLEMSNVDLAEAFTEMITAQRGFQANTRIITTSDEILQELTNLKR
ncbi:flagellar basal-body rod protein FlgG [Halobacillus andaensis]|uniref:Flagellar hook protein FlgE n=1 Tax=Halobacillus andaensis TaxID=1176239 RepID=A0A917AYR5_HALAA|nr:flagellar basal body rod protein FlgG [Halobacillus andaensis]MBP2003488.1 flagellar hook protein FlgE [Halobacillus andaensis]GGF11007.1 flagellar basal-body rod protein FlgG [Halobacillus andaensis]